MWLIDGFSSIAQGWYDILSAWFMYDSDHITLKTDEEAMEEDRAAIDSDWRRVVDYMRKAMGYEDMKIKNRCIPSPIDIQYGHVYLCSVHDSREHEFCSFRQDNSKSGTCDFVTSLWAYCNNKEAIDDIVSRIENIKANKELFDLWDSIDS